MSKKKTQQQPGKSKPVDQPKKDIKSEDSTPHPVADADRTEANEFQAEIQAQASVSEETEKKAITQERWLEAQKAEYEAHANDPRNTFQHYKEVYKTYFKYVELGNNLHGLHVIEIGPANHPALAHCENYGSSAIIEPMHNEKLFAFCRANNVALFDVPLEEIPDSNLLELRNNQAANIVEVWLFNVMQHVINPGEFIRKCQLVADRIRFFEPIDTPEAPHHPHTYTYQDYINYFGGCCKIYKGGSELNFHTADCIYGVWINPALENK